MSPYVNQLASKFKSIYSGTHNRICIFHEIRSHYSRYKDTIWLIQVAFVLIRELYSIIVVLFMLIHTNWLANALQNQMVACSTNLDILMELVWFMSIM